MTAFSIAFSFGALAISIASLVYCRSIYRRVKG